jgi:hypothetical protein
MRRRLKDDRSDRFITHKVKAETEPVRVALVTWAQTSRARLTGADPWMPDGLGERQEEMFGALFAIADLLGGTWPEDARG